MEEPPSPRKKEDHFVAFVADLNALRKKLQFEDKLRKLIAARLKLIIQIDAVNQELAIVQTAQRAYINAGKFDEQKAKIAYVASLAGRFHTGQSDEEIIDLDSSTNLLRSLAEERKKRWREEAEHKAEVAFLATQEAEAESKRACNMVSQVYDLEERSTDQSPFKPVTAEYLPSSELLQDMNIPRKRGKHSTIE